MSPWKVTPLDRLAEVHIWRTFTVLDSAVRQNMAKPLGRWYWRVGYSGWMYWAGFTSACSLDEFSLLLLLLHGRAVQQTSPRLRNSLRLYPRWNVGLLEAFLTFYSYKHAQWSAFYACLPMHRTTALGYFLSLQNSSSRLRFWHILTIGWSYKPKDNTDSGFSQKGALRPFLCLGSLISDVSWLVFPSGQSIERNEVQWSAAKWTVHSVSLYFLKASLYPLLLRRFGASVFSGSSFNYKTPAVIKK